MYGLKQSPLKFQKLLKEVLQSAGYSPLTNNGCVYVKHQKINFSILSVHVDDILQVSTSDVMINELREALINRFVNIVYHPNVTSYLGISIQRGDDRRSIYLTQHKLIDSLVSKYLSNTKDNGALLPLSNLDLFAYQSEGSLIHHRDYLSLVMSLIFIARMTRPDTLLKITYLASRSYKPYKIGME